MDKKKVNKIISLKKSTGVYGKECNICRRRDIELQELSLGSNNQAQCTVICKKCLSELGDLIWQKGI